TASLELNPMSRVSCRRQLGETLACRWHTLATNVRTNSAQRKRTLCPRSSKVVGHTLRHCPILGQSCPLRAQKSRRAVARLRPRSPGGPRRLPAPGSPRSVRAGLPPTAPPHTAPRIRARCETIDRLHHTGGWKRIPLKHRAKPIPSYPCAVRAPVQPLPPNAPDLIPIPLQGGKVSGEAVVGIASSAKRTRVA